MFRLSKVVALIGAVLAPAPALAIDPFFPEFGNNGIDVQHYDLRLDVNPVSGRLDAKAELKIVALRRLDSFTLDLANLSVSKVRVEGAAAGFRQANDKLRVAPARRLAAGDVFTVSIAYGGVPEPIQDPTAPGNPDYKLGWFKYQNSTYALSEPVGASTFYPANDEPTDKATFTFNITVPKGYTAVANGVLAATQATDTSKRFLWQMRDPMTTWLATVQVNRYRSIISRTPDGTLLRFYGPKGAPEEDLRNIARARPMLPFFETLIGRYPFKGYGSVLVEDPALYYALETQAMSTFPVGFTSDDVVAHELIHQWFGNAVSVKRWEDLWLAEGAATYFEFVWLHRNDPKAFDEALQDVYAYVREEEAGPAVVEQPDQLFNYERVYLRGATVYYALRQAVGDRVFYRILREFIRQYKGGNATAEDFIDTAVRVGGDGSVRRLLVKFIYDEEVPDLPGDRVARSGPVPRPDVMGTRCGRFAHRGRPAACATQ